MISSYFILHPNHSETNNPIKMADWLHHTYWGYNGCLVTKWKPPAQWGSKECALWKSLRRLAGTSPFGSVVNTHG
jgi:hypothetical protein